MISVEDSNGTVYAVMLVQNKFDARYPANASWSGQVCAEQSEASWQGFGAGMVEMAGRGGEMQGTGIDYYTRNTEVS